MNTLNKNIRILLLFLFSVLGASAQEVKVFNYDIHFRVGKYQIDTTFMDNAKTLNALQSFIEEIRYDTTRTIQRVYLSGYASLEGSLEINKKLAKKRRSEIEKVIGRRIVLPDSIIVKCEEYFPWKDLEAEILKSILAEKQEALSIIAEEEQIVPYIGTTHIDKRISKLRKVADGKFWREVFTKEFWRMRRASAKIYLLVSEVSDTATVTNTADVFEIEEQNTDLNSDTLISQERDSTTLIDAPDTIATITSEPETWQRQLTLKTNTLGLALLMLNASVEADICPHLSFALPIYYSGANYFKSDIKFRTFALQPELRYWFKENNERWFLGAHFGMAYFNVATNGDWRYQDRGREEPLLGGGISAGYKMPISRNEKWKLEFSLGLGVYSVKWDKFYNEPNGLWVGSGKDLYIGPDNASLSVCYTFDIGKKREVK